MLTLTYLRLTIPFIATNWPGRTDTRFGDNFQPGETLQWTNGIDFWTRTPANSLGFLDREPLAHKAGDQCRVLFIGDSFVEAAQVPIDKKFHVLFEQLVDSKSSLPQVETLAFGYSGTGQANQLAWYDHFGKPLQPNVVVLVVSANDFANNSLILESLRYRTHPSYPSRLFFKVTGDGERTVRLPIDPEAKTHRLTDEPSAVGTLHNTLHDRSYFYYWLFKQLQAGAPKLAGIMSGNSVTDSLPFHMRAIENIDGYESVFTDWDYPNDLDMDRMFFTEGSLPPLFEEALALTGFALEEFILREKNDGFHLVALAGHSFSPAFEPGALEMGRTMADRGNYKRLLELTSERGIPLVDQNSFILANGGDKRAARFSRDAHWSEQGHEWVAQAMLQYFLANPQMCSNGNGNG